MIKQYGDARDKVREDMKMARIFKDEGEAKIAELCERQYRDTLKWLGIAKVATGAPIAGRVPLPPSFWKEFSGVRKNTTPKRQGGGGAGSSTSLVKAGGGDSDVCEECKGRKTVPDEVVCSRCNGTGSIVRQTTIKDLSGNRLPAKQLKCTKCNGKGVVVVGRKPCDACGGKGRVAK